MMHVVIYQPVIPPNTGNIARQCVGMGARLHLVGPYEIDMSSKAVRRAGLDYWEHLELKEHETPEAFLDWLGDRDVWLVSKFGKLRYDRVGYKAGDVLVFGNEIKGLPSAWRERWEDRMVYIPMLGEIRSFNLANAAAMVMGEAWSTAGLYEGGIDKSD